MTKEDIFASIMNSDNQHPRDPSRPKRQSRMSREIVSSSTCCSRLLTFVFNVHSLDNFTLVTPTLEWQDRLSNSYARTNNLDLSGPSPSSLLHIGGQPSLQRRRLEKDAPVTSDWGRLYKLDPVSGMCNTHLLLSNGQFEPISASHANLESDDSDDDAASMLGELSLDENKEVCPDVINMRHRLVVSSIVGAVSWSYQRSSFVIPSRSYG